MSPNLSRPAAFLLLLALRAAAQPAPFDLYRPQVKASSYPAVILAHGGDFTSGNRKDAATVRMAQLFAQAGLLVYAIDYRLAPSATFPRAVDEVRAMAQWLRTNAQAQSADPQRIALAGQGAGGYLVNMAVARGAPAAAAISIAGWSDFRNQPMTPNLAAFLRTTPIEDASPAIQLTGNEPPFLLIHGDRDESVPLSQSLHLQSALQAIRVPCSLVIIEGGGHDPLSWDALPAARPWEREMLIWLQKALK